MMAVKPILFNTEMVQAILEGRKTQTRRIVKGIEDIHPYRAEPAETANDTLAEWDFLCGEHRITENSPLAVVMDTPISWFARLMLNTRKVCF